MMIDRRQFLRLGLYSTVPLLLESFSLSALAQSVQRGLERQGKTKTVIVLGAGLAGLAAAYELTQAGHDVTVLEARSRPGGRVYTLREAFPDGLYAEAGGQYFYPEEPDYALTYIQQFGLQTVPLQPKGTSVCYFRGTRLTCKRGAAIEWPLQLTSEEKSLGLQGLRQKYVRPVLQEFHASDGSCWPQAFLDKYDSRTFADVLRDRGASPDAIDLLRIIDWDFIGEGPSDTSAMELFGDRAKFSRFTKPFYSIKGGNDLLPRALAERLSDKIRYGAPATVIESGSESVRVTYRQADDQRTMAAEYLVCAIPFSVLKHLQISPGFSPEKTRAIHELPYTSVARVYFLSRRRFWNDENMTGLAWTDLPVIYFWESTWAQEGPRGILQAYAMGHTARQMAAMDDADRIRFALAHTDKVYPGMRELIEGAVSQCWDTDPWTRGGYSWLKLGAARSIVPHVATPEGRIHFAGEHTASCFRHATMQGALESGIRAAQEINRAA